MTKLSFFNCAGLFASAPEVVCDAFHSSHYVGLCETWLSPAADAVDCTAFGFMHASLPRPILSAAGSSRGGVSRLSSLSATFSVSCWRARAADGVLWQRLNGVPGLQGAVMVCHVYLPPGAEDTAAWFQTLAADCAEAAALGHVVVAGDFNARTGCLPDDTAVPRLSADRVIDTRGRQLVAFSQEAGLNFCNGHFGPSSAAATSSGLGRLRQRDHSEWQSVVDYVLVSDSLLPHVASLEVAVMAGLCSDHAALHLTLAPVAATPPPSPTHSAEAPAAEEPAAGQVLRPARYRWDQRRAQAFEAAVADAAVATELICIADAATRIESVEHRPAMDNLVERLEWVVEGCMAAAGMPEAGMQREPRWIRRVRLCPITTRLRRMRRQAARAARTGDSPRARAIARQIRALARRRRRSGRQRSGERMERLLEQDPRAFYARYRGRGAAPAAGISTQQWYAYFRQLLGGDVSQLGEAGLPPPPPPAGEDAATLSELCSPLQVAEVVKAIKRTKNGKAVVGQLLPDALKRVPGVMAATLTPLLNACARLSYMPARWAVSAISPIPKAGADTTVCNGYRGIAVGTLPAKLFANVLDTRLQNWAESRGKRATGQFGFRRRRGCAHAAMVLRTAVERERAAGGRLYTCFVDFQKAYDTVPRELLWYKLRCAGLTGWIMDAMRALYSSVPMCVKTSDGYTATFESTVGVKQGCPLSPLLFGLYVDDLEREVLGAAAGLDLPSLDAAAPLPPLMYADDLALLSRSVRGLQNQLQLLEAYAHRWGLTVNVAKTKVVVFGRRRLPSSDVLSVRYGGKVLEVVDSFKYLGIVFHASHAFAAAASPRVAAARRAMHATRRRCAELGLTRTSMQLRLFDVFVTPVLSYGAEIWAPQLLAQGSGPCEPLHLEFLRHLMGGLRQSTPALVVQAEAGRLPIAAHITARLAGFWNSILAESEDSLVRQAMCTSCDLAVAMGGAPLAQLPWAGQVAAALAQAGVVVNLQRPQQLSVQAVKDACLKRQVEALAQGGGTKIRHYVDCVRGQVTVDTYQPAVYLELVERRSRRAALARLRTGAHWLAEETGRWARLARHERRCEHCVAAGHDVVEDVAHVVFDCPRFTALRQRFSPKLCFGDSCLSQFFAQDAAALAAFARAVEDGCRK